MLDDCLPPGGPSGTPPSVEMARAATAAARFSFFSSLADLALGSPEGGW